MFFENSQKFPGRFYVFGFFSDTKRAQKRRKQNGRKNGRELKGAKQFGDNAYKPGEKKAKAKWRDGGSRDDASKTARRKQNGASKMAQALWTPQRRQQK